MDGSWLLPELDISGLPSFALRLECGAALKQWSKSVDYRLTHWAAVEEIELLLKEHETESAAS